MEFEDALGSVQDRMRLHVHLPHRLRRTVCDSCSVGAAYDCSADVVVRELRLRVGAGRRRVGTSVNNPGCI